MAVSYIRVNKPVKYWLVLIPIILLYFIMVLLFPIEHKQSLIHIDMTPYLIALLIAKFLSSYYDCYTHSVKMFNDGIKLPIRRSKLYTWENVSSISRAGATVSLKLSFVDIAYSINHEDIEDADQMIKDWSAKKAEI